MTNSIETQLAVIAENMKSVKADLIDIKKKLEDKYVTKDQLQLVKKDVGAITRIMWIIGVTVITGIVGAILNFIFVK